MKVKSLGPLLFVSLTWEKNSCPLNCLFPTRSGYTIWTPKNNNPEQCDLAQDGAPQNPSTQNPCPKLNGIYGVLVCSSFNPTGVVSFDQVEAIKVCPEISPPQRLLTINDNDEETLSILCTSYASNPGGQICGLGGRTQCRYDRLPDQGHSFYPGQIGALVLDNFDNPAISLYDPLPLDSGVCEEIVSIQDFNGETIQLTHPVAFCFPSSATMIDSSPKGQVLADFAQYYNMTSIGQLDIFPMYVDGLFGIYTEATPSKGTCPSLGYQPSCYYRLTRDQLFQAMASILL